MRSVKRLFAVVLGLGTFAGVLACGPSFQAIYEGNSRFEHCYALEENAQSPLRDKADCWRDWSERYTYGQTRDRIHYATARYVALSQSTNLPTDEAMMMAAPGMTPRQSTITAPAPTNAFAPPPKVLDEADAASLPARSPRLSETPFVVGQPTDAGTDAPIQPYGSAGAPLPGAKCGDDCAKKFQDCSSSCAPSAKSVPRVTKDGACATCEQTYKTCARACLK